MCFVVFRVLVVCRLSGAENVCVVVTRWYGGVHLGPDRFKDINNTGRALLESEGYIKGKSGKSPKKKNKKKRT